MIKTVEGITAQLKQITKVLEAINTNIVQLAKFCEENDQSREWENLG